MSLLVGLFIFGAAVQHQEPIELKRTYKEGEHLSYTMTGLHEDRGPKQRYSAKADGIVRQRPDGAYMERFAWSDVVWDGKRIELPPASLALRQELSLDPKAPFVFPDLRNASPSLIGPITDLMTFYADLLLPMRSGSLKRRGDHFLYVYSKPASWADGSRVKIGEDSIDFDVTLDKVDRRRNQAVIIVRHVPPAKPGINLPAKWMSSPVGKSANNWVQVSVRDGGKVAAAVGRETFNITITVDLTDGRMVSAVEDNVVDVVERECADASCLNPGPPQAYRIHRLIQIRSN